MDKRKSFENAMKTVQNTGFGGATQKMKAIDFAAQFKERGIDIGSSFDK